MKALSLWQPWASLIALGVKTIETRSWSTTYRGPLLIHAGQHLARLDEAPACWDLLGLDAYTATRSTEAPSRFPEGEQVAAPLPLGAVVATCTLEFVVPTEDVRFDGTQGSDYVLVASPSRATLHSQSGNEPLGDFTRGRYAWALADIRPLPEPIPARGRQGLWTPDADLIAAVEAADA